MQLDSPMTNATNCVLMKRIEGEMDEMKEIDLKCDKNCLVHANELVLFDIAFNFQFATSLVGFFYN